MTIYVVKWSNTQTNEKFHKAFSSFANAQKKVRDVLKDKECKLEMDADGSAVFTNKMKKQNEVIDLINTL